MPVQLILRSVAVPSSPLLLEFPILAVKCSAVRWTAAELPKLTDGTYHIDYHITVTSNLWQLNSCYMSSWVCPKEGQEPEMSSRVGGYGVQHVHSLISCLYLKNSAVSCIWLFELSVTDLSRGKTISEGLVLASVSKMVFALRKSLLKTAGCQSLSSRIYE